jgi:uncharacterized protein
VSFVARAIAFALAAMVMLLGAIVFATGPAYSQQALPKGSRPGYIYDYAHVISPEYYKIIDTYLRGLDDATTNEIVIYTITSFTGHGIKKDGIEIQSRDMLANYIYNELPLDGTKGIGKKGKDNGVLVLMSLEPDAGGGSMRIEVGRGLEGEITDGTAGEILDRYLVPARQEYKNTGNTTVFDRAFLNTVVALGTKTGYQASDANLPVPTDNNNSNSSRPASDDNTGTIIFVLFIVLVIGIGVLNAKYGRGRRRRGGYFIGGGGGFGGGGGGWGGGGGGGGFGGGGGSSGGGGAGR